MAEGRKLFCCRATGHDRLLPEKWATRGCGISATGFRNALCGAFRGFHWPPTLRYWKPSPGFPGGRGDRDAVKMPLKKLAFIAVALALGGCLSDTLDPTPDSALKPRDKKLLASAPYLNHKPGEGWLRHYVDYSGKEKPGTVV